MRTRVIVLSGILLGGCGGDDPGGGQSGTSGSGDAGPVDIGFPPNAQGGSNGSDAAIAQPPDDPGVFVSHPVDAFTDAPPYESGMPSMRANAMHADGPVTGKPCLSCHDGVTCVKFDFAGTVWRAPALTDPVPDVEVRIIGADSYAHVVHSDADGNFWHFGSKDLPLPAFSGVRTAHFTAIGKLNGTSCNTCHNTNVQTPGRLFVK